MWCCIGAYIHTCMPLTRVSFQARAVNKNSKVVHQVTASVAPYIMHSRKKKEAVQLTPRFCTQASVYSLGRPMHSRSLQQYLLGLAKGGCTLLLYARGADTACNPCCSGSMACLTKKTQNSST